MVMPLDAKGRWEMSWTSKSEAGEIREHDARAEALAAQA
jgi:hypothetical protein